MIFSNGYIHPDEFFQGPQIVSKDIFDFQNIKIPWEFSNKETPIRTILLPMIVSGNF
jgi:GPI mannosyltransferase 4